MHGRGEESPFKEIQISIYVLGFGIQIGGLPHGFAAN